MRKIIINEHHLNLLKEYYFPDWFKNISAGQKIKLFHGTSCDALYDIFLSGVISASKGRRHGETSGVNWFSTNYQDNFSRGVVFSIEVPYEDFEDGKFHFMNNSEVISEDKDIDISQYNLMIEKIGPFSIEGLKRLSERCADIFDFVERVNRLLPYYDLCAVDDPIAVQIIRQVYGEDVLKSEGIIEKTIKNGKNLSEARMDGFRLDTLRNIPFEQRVEYCNKMLGDPIGDGSSRVVYQLDDGSVLKLAKNDKGVAQNKLEIEYSKENYSKNLDLFPNVLNGTDENKFLWVVSEYVLPAKEQDFGKVCGFPWEMVKSFIAWCGNIRKDVHGGACSDEDAEYMLDEDSGREGFLINLMDFINSFNASAADLLRIENWGMCMRNGKPKMVILDSGLNENVWIKNYMMDRLKTESKKSTKNDVNPSVDDEYMIASEGGANDYFHVVNENIENEVEASEVDMSSFKKNKTLAPKIWDGNKLNSKVRLKLLDIADSFWGTVDINWVEPKGMMLVGSICNYNWSKFSDIDLHIVVDFNEISENKDFVQDYFNAKKNEWNNLHDNLTMYGFPVELYVEDVDADTSSGGKYDLEKNTWIKKPSMDSIKQVGLEKYEIKELSAKYMTKIDDLRDMSDTEDEYVLRKTGEKASKLWKKIKAMRKYGVDRGGESDQFNIMYKVLRRTGYLDKLFDLKSELFDKLHSIVEQCGISPESFKQIVLTEEVVADGNAAHNVYDKRWKQEREILKNFIINNGKLQTSKENGKKYMTYFDSMISNYVGVNYCLCVQYDPMTLDVGNTVYIRACDKFTDRMFTAQNDTSGYDNVSGTKDDIG